MLIQVLIIHVHDWASFAECEKLFRPDIVLIEMIFRLHLVKFS